MGIHSNRRLGVRWLLRADPTRSTERKWDRSIGITVLTGIVLLLILGLVFSVAYGSRRITTSAESLHDADEVLRSATVVRAQLALASHMVAVDQTVGAYSGESIGLSIEEASAAMEDFGIGVELLKGDGFFDTDSVEAAAAFRTSAEDLILAIEEWVPFSEHAELGLGAAFENVVTETVIVRDGLASQVASSDKLLGQIGNIARFLVAFLIPAAVILIYRELIRRQQRQVELETRLDAERQINTAREQFVANASHELRTPLTSIMGLSMMLGENPAVVADATALELVSIIVGESEDLARMVEDLLTVARLDAGALHYSYEDIGVRDELDEIGHGAERSGINITWSTDDATVRADRLRFRQILRNLVSNAKKYGGPNVRLEGAVDGRTFVVSVIDDGNGVPEHLRERLFERFIHQGNKVAARDSVGLGLSIVHSLTHDMGGSISYEYTGNESHFIVRLPLAIQSLPELEDYPASHSAA